MKKLISYCVLPLLTLLATVNKTSAGTRQVNAQIHYLFPTAQLNAGDTTIESQKGIDGFASFYAKMFEGLKTANGEIFSHSKLTAASNFFPLNTLVRITNLRNGKSVLVKITDRMHPNMTSKGRVVDLSMAAAKKIQMITSNGLAKVNVQKVEDDDDN